MEIDIRNAAFFRAVRPLSGRSLRQMQFGGLNALLAAAGHETARETLAATDDQAVSRLENAWPRVS